MSDLTFADAVRIARGCTDYLGGYTSDAQLLETFRHGIGTVVCALERASQDDPQTQSLLAMSESDELRSLRAQVEELMAERDEARRDFLVCAEAIGVVYEADGHATAPGPADVVVERIRDAVRRSGERDEARAERASAEALAEGMRRVMRHLRIGACMSNVDRAVRLVECAADVRDEAKRARDEAVAALADMTAQRDALQTKASEVPGLSASLDEAWWERDEQRARAEAAEAKAAELTARIDHEHRRAEALVLRDVAADETIRVLEARATAAEVRAEKAERELVEAREVAVRNATDCGHLRQSAIVLTAERDEARDALGAAWLTSGRTLAEGIRYKTAWLERLVEAADTLARSRPPITPAMARDFLDGGASEAFLDALRAHAEGGER